MTLFTRVEARDFRVLFGRCLAGRPRAPAPFLLIRFAAGMRTLCSTTSEGVIVMHSSVAEGGRDELLVLPDYVLVEVEGSTDEGVNLNRQSTLRGTLHWHTGDKPRQLAVESLMPGKQHAIPELPTLTSAPVRLLSALHECGRSAARNNGRMALSQVQIHGRSGRVIGTDGKAALLYGDFKFGFPDSVLVPALPVFGSRPLGKVTELKIGRTSTHLVVDAGPWSVWLPTDRTSRYPDVAGVIPRHAPTTVVFDDQDVTELLRALPALPGNDDETRPVIIAATGHVAIRGRSLNSTEVKEITLARSRATGTPACLTLDRRFLARALSLGCRTLAMTPDKPFVLEGDGLVFVALPLLSATSVESSVDGPSTLMLDPNRSRPSTNPERNRVMESPKMNGHTPPRGDPADPLAVAEELRDALADATNKAARLVMVLKAGKKEKKVLSSVLASLKQLSLDAGGSP